MSDADILLTVHQKLAELGLNEKEIKIYLALLTVGTSPASTLGERTDIQRSTAQYTCQQLHKMGIITMIQKGNTYLYSPEPPEKLLLLLRKQQEELAVQEESVQRMIGTLKSLANPLTILPKVRFYEGKDQMVELYEQILSLESPIDSFEDKGEMQQFIPEYIPAFIKGRQKKAIWNRVICPSTTIINKDTPMEYRQVRTLPVSEFPFSCDIKICKDQVSIFSFEKNTAVGIAVRHEDIANNFRLLFEQFWMLLGKRASDSNGMLHS